MRLSVQAIVHGFIPRVYETSSTDGITKELPSIIDPKKN